MAWEGFLKPRHPRVASKTGRGAKKAPRKSASIDFVTAPVSLPLQAASETENPPLSLPLPEGPPCPRCGTKYYSFRENCNTCGELHPDKLALSKYDRLSENSKVRETAVKICMMEAAGIGRKEIAEALGIQPSTLVNYLYKAGKNGWLDFDDPKDQLEYKLMHKVIRNLDEALDSEAVLNTGAKERNVVALKIAEGTLYPKIAMVGPVAVSSVVGVKIEIVGGEPGTMREGTIMGTSTYQDAETAESDG